MLVEFAGFSFSPRFLADAATAVNVAAVAAVDVVAVAVDAAVVVVEGGFSFSPRFLGTLSFPLLFRISWLSSRMLVE